MGYVNQSVKELFPVFTSALLTNSHPNMIIMFKSRKNSISMSKFNFIVTENRCNIINVDVAGSYNQIISTLCDGGSLLQVSNLFYFLYIFWLCSANG